MISREIVPFFLKIQGNDMSQTVKNVIVLFFAILAICTVQAVLRAMDSTVKVTEVNSSLAALFAVATWLRVGWKD